jgi:branched-chain amino acid transport system ATP-binding protein
MPRSRRDLEMVYNYFPRLQRTPDQPGGLYLRRRAADVRDRPRADEPAEMILLDEPSMGLAPQLVEEIFEIVRQLNENEGVSFLLAEQNTNVALKYATYGYILESGRDRSGRRGQGAARERRRQGVLSWCWRREPPLVPDVKHYKRRKRWLA